MSCTEWSPIFLEGMPSLEWHGGHHAVISLTKYEWTELEREVRGGLPRYSIKRADPARREAWEPVRSDLDSDARLYTLELFRDVLNGEGYDFIVKKVLGRWVVVAMKMTWIS
ncbi:MAG: hypothetical protein U0166_14200 [Acidobacteriota bacterium]